jgi:hypothetical protein
MSWFNERVEITRFQQLIGGLSIVVLNVQFLVGIAHAIFN